MCHMKLFRVLLLLLIISFLPFTGAFAAEHDYSPVPADRILCELPIGMEADVRRSDGLLEISIDADSTDWGLVLAAALSDWGTITAPISASAPSGAEKQHNIHLMNGEYQSSSTLLDDMFAEFDHIIDVELSSKPSGSIPYVNEWDLASYDEANNAILPISANDETYHAHFVAWEMGNGETLYEYFMVNVRYTDDSARTVELNTVDAARIVPQINADASVSDGSVAYSFASDSVFLGQSIQTGVTAPRGAASYAVTFFGDTFTSSGLDPLSDNSYGLLLPLYVPEQDVTESSSASILWYESDDASGMPIAAEHLNIQITVGEPQPFPRYIDELSAIPASRMLPVILNNGIQENPAFISADYAQSDDRFDILTKSVQLDSVPAGADLSGYSTKLYAFPPSGAVAYSVAFRTRSTIYGSMQQYYEDSFVPMLTSASMRSSAFETVNGKKAAPLHQAPLFKTRTFSHDPSLTLYTSRDSSDPYTGRVIMVYWYDSLEEDAQPIAKEYMIDKVDPFSIILTSPAYDSEDDITKPVSIPVVVTNNNIGIQNLMLVIEKPVFTGEDCTLYGLYLADANENKVEIGEMVTIILPYPDIDADINTVRFSINHYNDDDQYLETYSEDNGLLVRTAVGLAFQTDSFSPFVLSWDDSAVLAADELPKTGDTSSMMILLFTLTGSLAALTFLKKKHA